MLRAISVFSRRSGITADRQDPVARPDESGGSNDDLLAFNEPAYDFDTGAACKSGLDIAEFDDIVGRELNIAAILAEADGGQRHGDGLSLAECNAAAGKNTGPHGRMG
ncbi:MAG: hypothetical protein E6575_13610, partial [Bradyrhizobium sp.]|nr:hypothetical protein [Bradyrhizobium sp.]